MERDWRLEERDRLLDEMVWAVDHLADSRIDLREQAGGIIDRARAQVEAWHRERAERMIDLRDAEREPENGGSRRS